MPLVTLPEVPLSSYNSVRRAFSRCGNPGFIIEKVDTDLRMFQAGRHPYHWNIITSGTEYHYLMPDYPIGPVRFYQIIFLSILLFCRCLPAIGDRCAI